MEKFISDKLSKIENLEERRLLKDIIQGVFTDIMQNSKEKYRQLEENVYQELSEDPTKYAIYTTVCNRTEYKKNYNNGFLYPMISENVQYSSNREFDIDIIKEKLKKKEKVILFDFFMECDTKIIKKMLDEPLKYQLEINTDQNVYWANIEISPSLKYIEPIQNLYETFQCNKIAWKTVNNPYAYKFMDVILKELPPIHPTESIKEVILHLGSYDQFKRMNMILLWNVKYIRIEDKSFPIPMENGDKFEHRFSLEKMGNFHGYLARKSNSHLISVRQDNNNLILTSNWANAKGWDFIKIINAINHDTKWLSYELVGNQCKTSFADRFASQNSIAIRTKGEIQRIINGFYVADEINLCSIEIKACRDTIGEINNLNSFIKDEIRKETSQYVMVLNFSTTNYTFITLEQIHFLTSEIQYRFPEYECMGILM